MNSSEYRTQFIESPPYLEPLNFEKDFNYQKWSHLMAHHWHWSVYASIIYVASVFYGQSWMASRQPFRLKGLLILWNAGLCIGSLVMFTRLFPELWYELSNFGVKHAVCNADNHSVSSSFWLLIFILSKIVEFGDTAFIVARKQKLIFLHWYHHTTVAIYCFYHFVPFDTASRWFAPINAFIHTIMYGYYAAKAIEIKVPTLLSKIITSMQITQMFIGVFVNLLSYHMKANGERCDRTYMSMFLALLMYASYLVLFIQFFNAAYNKPKKPKGTSSTLQNSKQKDD